MVNSRSVDVHDNILKPRFVSFSLQQKYCNSNSQSMFAVKQLFNCFATKRNSLDNHVQGFRLTQHCFEYFIH
jgi:hypothetical protein